MKLLLNSLPTNGNWGKKSGLLMLLTFCCIPSMANDGLIVIPSKNAAYLYNPAGNETIEEIDLRLVKEGSFSNYRIESDPPGFLCDESCKETVQRLPSGKVTLKIIGDKPFPLMKIPLRGIWEEGCENPTEELQECEMHLNETNSLVKVEVDPNVVAGTIMPMPGEGFDAMFISADASRGYALFALHHLLSPTMGWLDFDPSRRKNIGAGSIIDGRSNSIKLTALNSEAANYCRQIETESASWHLPASGELSAITVEALDKIPALDKENCLWTSTERSLAEKTHHGNRYIQLQVSTLNNKSANIENTTAWEYDLQKDGTWKEDEKRTKRCQALCVTQVPL